MSKAHNRNDARSISCPKCGAQIVEPGADVYKCPNCATFYLAKGSGRLDSGNYKHRRHRKDDEGRPNSSGGRSIPENATLINPPAGSINPSNSAGNLLRPHESSYTEELPDSETSSSTTWSSEVASPNGVLEVTSSHFGKWEHRSKNGSAKDFRSVDGSGSTHQDEFLEVAEDKGHWLPVLNSEFRIISETSDARNEHDDSRLPQDMADVQYGESSNIDAIQSMQKHMFDLKILGISDDASLHTRLKPDKVTRTSGTLETKVDDNKSLSGHEFSTPSTELVRKDTVAVSAQSTMTTTALTDTVSYYMVPHQTQNDVIVPHQPQNDVTDSLTVEPDLEFLMAASACSGDSVDSAEQVSSSSGRSGPLRWNGKKGSDSQNSSRNLTSMKEESRSPRVQLNLDSASRSVRSRRQSTSNASSFKGSNPIAGTGAHEAPFRSSSVPCNAHSHDMMRITSNVHSYHGMALGHGEHYNLHTPETSPVHPDYMQPNASHDCMICVHERYHVRQPQVASNITTEISASHQHSNSDVYQQNPHRIHPHHGETSPVHYRPEVHDSVSEISRKQKIYPPLPGKGAAPYVLCKHCEQLLQVPGYLHPDAGSFQRLKCGDCAKVSRFYVVDGAMQPFDSPVYVLHNDGLEVNSYIQEQSPAFEGSVHAYASKTLHRSQNSIPAGAPLIDHLSRSIKMSSESYRKYLLQSSMNLSR